MAIYIKKILFKHDKISIWMGQDIKSKDDDAPISSVLHCREYPDTSFFDALGDLDNTVYQILGLEYPGDEKADFMVHGINIKYKTDENCNRVMHGCTLHCIARLAHTKSENDLVIWQFETPYLKFNQAKDEFVFPDYEAVNRLLSETFAYMDGKRAQGDLFTERQEDEMACKQPEQTDTNKPDSDKKSSPENDRPEGVEDDFTLLKTELKSIFKQVDTSITTKDRFDNSLSAGCLVTDKKNNKYLIYQVYKNGKIKIRPVQIHQSGKRTWIKTGYASTDSPKDFSVTEDMQVV